MSNFFKSLRFRLLVLVVVALLPAIGVILVGALELYQHTMQEAQKSVQRLVALVVVIQTQKIQDSRQLLLALSQLPEVRSRDVEAFRTKLGHILEQSPAYENFGLIGPDGHLIASVRPVSTSVYLGDRQYFQEALKNRQFPLSKPLISRGLQKRGLAFTYPVLNESGRAEAGLFASLNFAWLYDLADQAKLPAGSTLTIIADDGAIMAKYPHPEQWVGTSLPPEGLLDIIQKRGRGIAEAVDMDGVSRLFAFMPLGQEPRIGYVIAGIPKHVVNALAYKIMIRNLAILGITLALALGLAWWCGYLFVTRRVDPLIQTAQQMAAGDLSVRVGFTRGPEEFEQLSQAFDHMAASLEERETMRRKAEDELRESENKYRTLVETTDTGFVILDKKGLVIDANLEYVRLSGQAALEEVLGRSVLEWTAEEDRDKNALEISQCLRQGFVRNLEINYTAETGLSTPIEINATVVDDKDNPIILSLCRDISERKQAEEEIKAALQEKEVLLLEIHHRVKNNLQVISSLLSLQSSRMEDKKAATILRETKDKIYAMALLYERLCQSKNLAIISFPSYVAALVTSLFQSIEADSARIAPRFNVANLPIDIDTAIPCGLIINELVTNAIKYAFPDGREGEIHITLSPAPDDQVILVVSDNGVGISPDLDLSQVKSLGLQLVRGLAAQLQGSLDIEHNGGTTFRITFPLPGIKN